LIATDGAESAMKPHNGSMDRILEPEIMDGEAEAAAYARADFSDSNQAYVANVVHSFPAHLAQVVDLGCGPGDIAIRLNRAAPMTRITGVDGSRAMLAIARQALRAARLEASVSFLEGRLPGVPLPAGSFDLVLCKDMLHHLADPQVLWSEVRKLGRPGAVVCVMDLCRPRSSNAFRVQSTRCSRPTSIIPCAPRSPRMRCARSCRSPNCR
jgi:ubiquinone/menaquinone biosynthesis C-methylase UbiE